MARRDGGSVGSVVERVRRRVRRRARLAAGLLALGAAGAALPMAWLLAGDGWRDGSAWPLVLVALGAAGAAVGAASVFVAMRTTISEAVLAADLERSVELPGGAVRSQIELTRNAPHGVSPALIRAGEETLAARLLAGGEPRPHDADRRSARLLRGGALLTGGVAVVALGLLVLTPDRSRAAWAGLASPLSVLRPDPLPPLDVWPGDAEVNRGEEVEVEIGAPGRDSVALYWEGEGEVRQSLKVPVLDGRGAGRIPPVEGETRYWVGAPDGAVSPAYTLRPLDPLLLADLTLELDHPAHTGLPDEVLRSIPSSLSLPEGTRLRLSGMLAGEGTEVRLAAADGGVLARFPVADDAFAGEWRPRASVTASWEVAGPAPAGMRLPPPFDVEVVPDAPPLVSLDTETGAREVPGSRRVALRLEAVDDWGLDWVELEVVVEAADGRRGEPATDRSDAENRREVLLRPVLDMREWGLEPGSRVRLRARAADRAPVPGVTSSSEVVLRVAAAEELRADARGSVESAAERLEEMAEAAARGESAFRDRLREMSAAEARGAGSRGGEEEFRQREEVRGLVEEQAALARDLEEMREELERARESLAGGEEERELRERLAELERLLEELGGPEARERLESLLERVREGNPPPAMEELRDAAARQETLRQRLEEALERFRRAALESAFEGAQEDAQSLAERQEEVAEEIRADTSPEAERAQEALAREAEALEDRLRDLEERLRDAGEAQAADRTQGARQEMAASQSAMEAAAEAGSRGDSDAAGDRADDAARDAASAANELEEARKEWMREWEERVRETLERGAQDALSLARRQGEIRGELEAAGAVRRRELAAEEAVLVEGIRNLANQLAVATREAGSVGRDLSRALGEAIGAVERTAQGLRASAPRAATYGSAGEAQDALNRSALLALQGIEQLGGDGAGDALEQLMQDLEDLAGQQESLNQQSGSLAQDPGQQGAEARMEEIAGGQQTLAGALGELAQRPGGERLPGDLGDMAREAREIAQELDGGRLDARTLERQYELLERLLDAGRTIERDGPTDEREGTPAGAVIRPPIRPLPPDLLREAGIPLPSATALEALSPAERRLVLDYFDRLNRQRGGDGGIP